MFELVRKHREREDGFTLIELLVVIAIISILVAIAIGAFTAQKGAAVDASVKSDVDTTRSAIESMRVGETNAQHYAGSNAETGKKLTLTVGSTTATEPVSLSDGVQVRVSTHPASTYEYIIDGWHDGAKEANGTDAVWRYDSLTGKTALYTEATSDPGDNPGDGSGGNIDYAALDAQYGLNDGLYAWFAMFAETARANAPEGAVEVYGDALSGNITYYDADGWHMDVWNQECECWDYNIKFPEAETDEMANAGISYMVIDLTNPTNGEIIWDTVPGSWDSEQVHTRGLPSPWAL